MGTNPVIGKKQNLPWDLQLADGPVSKPNLVIAISYGYPLSGGYCYNLPFCHVWRIHWKLLKILDDHPHNRFLAL